MSDYSDAARGGGCPGAPPSRLQQRPRVARRICTGRRPTQGAPRRRWQGAGGRSTGWPRRGKVLQQARHCSLTPPFALNTRCARSDGFCYARLLESRQAWLGCKYPSAKQLFCQMKNPCILLRQRVTVLKRHGSCLLPCRKISKASGEKPTPFSQKCNLLSIVSCRVSLMS